MSKSALPLLPATRIQSLEVCRGLAAVVVFFNHYLYAFTPGATALLSGTPLYTLVNGRSAVIFFFVLSGYVLTFRFYELNDGAILAKGAIKRLPRLAGTTTLITLASCALFLTGAYHFAAAAAINRSGWLATSGYADFPAGFRPNFWGAFWQGSLGTFLRGDDNYNTNLWTMNVEFMGSLLVFGLAWPLRNLFGLRGYLLAAVLAGLFFIFHEPMLLPFIGGTTMAYAHSRRAPTLGLKAKMLAAAVCLVLFSYNPSSANGAWDFARPEDAANRALYDIFFPTCAALLLIQVVASKGQIRPVGRMTRFGRWLGAASFPLYLCHTLVIWSLSSWMFAELRPAHGIIMTTAVILPVTIGVVLAVSWVLTAFDQYWTRLINRGMVTVWRRFGPPPVAILAAELKLVEAKKGQ